MNRLRELGWGDEIRINQYCDNLLEDRRVRRDCQQELTGKGNNASRPDHELTDVPLALEGVVDYLVGYLKQAKERRLSESSHRD